MKKRIYAAEEFSFGGSIKGGIVSLKAKLKEILSDDQNDIVRYATFSAQLLERIGKLELELKAKKGEYQNDVAMIPIGTTVRSLWCDGKLITKPAELEHALHDMSKLLRARETVIYPKFKIFLVQFGELMHGLLADKDITTKDLSELLNILDVSKSPEVGIREYIGNVTTGVSTHKLYDSSCSYIGFSKNKPPASTDVKIEAFTRDECKQMIPICHEIASLNSDWFRSNNSRAKAVQRIVGDELNNVMDLLTKIDKMRHPKGDQLIDLYNGAIDFYHGSFEALAFASNETTAAVTRLMEMSARRWY